MKTPLWRAAAFCAMGLMALAFFRPTMAQYPDKPIRLVVPAGAGGITDVLARIVGNQLATVLKQSVIVDNRAGASGVIGSQIVATAKPDGYTLLMAFPTHVANPSTIKAIPYDTLKDFAPVAKVGLVTEILLVSNDGGIGDMKTLLARARAGKDALTYGSVGTGSQGDLCTLVFQNQVGAKLLPVTFKSEPEMTTALIRNDIQVAFVSPPGSLQLIRNGKLKALAVTSSKRLQALPDVPTIAESGLAGYDVTGWNAIFAPARTPPEIVAKLNAAINQVLAMPEVIKQFVELGVPPLGGTAEELQRSVKADIDSIGKTLSAVGFVPQ